MALRTCVLSIGTSNCATFIRVYNSIFPVRLLRDRLRNAVESVLDHRKDEMNTGYVESRYSITTVDVGDSAPQNDWYVYFYAIQPPFHIVDVRGRPACKIHLSQSVRIPALCLLGTHKRTYNARIRTKLSEMH